jgi:hypothetical protein
MIEWEVLKLYRRSLSEQLLSRGKVGEKISEEFVVTVKFNVGLW